MRIRTLIFFATVAACEASPQSADAWVDPCLAPGQAGCCVVDADCEDGTKCTQASCVAGQCVREAVSGCCVDSADCDDRSSCTTDFCQADTGACYNAPLSDGLFCDDGDVCRFGTRCSAGFCRGGQATVCSDGNPCTQDACVSPTGCRAEPMSDGAECSDGQLCTVGDGCLGGSCHGAALACDDGDVCTKDACEAATGACSTAPVQDGAPCQDDDVCTFSSTCVAGACGPGKAVACDDGNPCTQDACISPSGCHATPLAQGSPCDDGNACTSGDACHGASCTGGVLASCDDGDPCTADVCDAVTGTCASKPGNDGGPCVDDDVCTFDSKCAAGDCTGGKQAVCEDGNGCTVDVCVSKVGCTPTPAPAGTPCSDGSPCTESDVCVAGICKGAAVSCDDGDPCTIDSCQKATGCAHAPDPKCG